MTFLIGVPTLNRVDLLEQSLPLLWCGLHAEAVIVDNGAWRSAGHRARVEALARKLHAAVLPQERNLGVAASWNVIIARAQAAGHDWILMTSDDCLLREPASRVLAMLDRTIIAQPLRTLHVRGWNMFGLPLAVVDRVGLFDENFYPAYREDCDYAQRCRLAGVTRMPLPGIRAEHLGSQTILRDRRLLDGADALRAYYLSKWGGDCGDETFSSPFNSGRDWRWWPAAGERSA